MCAVAAAPQFQVAQAPVPILKSTSDISQDGTYKYEYETGNGIQAAENGHLNAGGLQGSQSAQGYFQYISPEGIPISVTCTYFNNY